MQYAYAAESLTPLPPDHVLVQKAEGRGRAEDEGDGESGRGGVRLHSQPRRAGDGRQHPGAAVAGDHPRRGVQEVVGRREARTEEGRPTTTCPARRPRRCASSTRRARWAMVRWRICAWPTGRRRSSSRWPQCEVLARGQVGVGAERDRGNYRGRDNQSAQVATVDAGRDGPGAR